MSTMQLQVNVLCKGCKTWVNRAKDESPKQA